MILVMVFYNMADMFFVARLHDDAVLRLAERQPGQ